MRPTIPEFVEMKRKTVEDRLSNYVETDTGCWEYQGSLLTDGYGILGVRKTNGKKGLWCYTMHRLSYYYHKHTDPASLVVRHDCDNPCCINPAHLRLGTHKDNARDAMERGRKPRGEKHCQSKLTDKNVLDIKKRLYGGETHRAIAKDFGIHRTGIQKINAGVTWKHIQLPEETLPCVRVCTEQLRLW